MSSKLYQHLSWDSELLKIATAKLIPDKLDTPTLQQVLKQLRQQKVKLVYWCAAANHANQQAAAVCQGQVVDHKVTYLLELSRIKTPSRADFIKEYPPGPADAELLQLGFASGEYSRFRIDKNLSQAQFERLYREWIHNSTRHKVAQKVLVIPGTPRWDGFITLGEKAGRGDIGLLAVASHSRGQGFGKALVQAAQCYFLEQHYAWSQVVTQQANQPACRLYEHCGYQLEKLEYFYHFWL